MFFIDGTIHIIAVSVAPHDGDSSKLWPASMRSSRVHWEARLSRPSRCFKVGASESSPPLWPGINAALTLQGDADRFMREVRADKGVLVLNHFRCSTGNLQNYSISALSFLRNCGKNRYSTARFPSPSSSTARARPREATGQPLYRSASTKRCMHDH